VSLAWSASSAPNVVGYRLYYGTAPRTYSQSFGAGVAVGNTTTFNVSGLTAGKTYYFAVTAVDNLGNESAYSNEASKAVQ
jgi:fibronectin type 3 domain-containing protein